MNLPLDIRNTALYEGRTPDEIYTMWKEASEARILRVFDPARDRPVVVIRDSPSIHVKAN